MVSESLSTIAARFKERLHNAKNETLVDSKESQSSPTMRTIDSCLPTHDRCLQTPLSLLTTSPPNSHTTKSQEINDLINDLQDENDDLLSDAGSTTTCGNDETLPEELFLTDLNTGLSTEEARLRCRKYGPNMLSEESQSMVLKFLSFFYGPIQFVMEAAAVLAAALQDWIDFSVIFALLLLNAIVGFTQEYRAGSIVEELRKTLAKTAIVLRDSEFKEILASEVQPGDVIRVEEGTAVAADGKLLTDSPVSVDQSSITGESLTVKKHRNEILYSSSTIKRGEGIVLVTATGDRSFVGRAAKLARKAGASSGHFTEVLEGIGTILLIIVVVTLLVVWVSAFYRSLPLMPLLRYTLAITIIGVPVGLPAVVTTTMAVGAAFLARKQAIVQRLNAIESLAGVEILCSDKTGTLTKNRLSLSEPYTIAGITADELMLTACLASSCKRKGLDPIDKALLTALPRYPQALKLLAEHVVTEFSPFDPVSKKVVSTVKSSDGNVVKCVKGAPLFILRMIQDGNEIDSDVLEDYNNKVSEFAANGYRSIGVARKIGDEPWKILGIVPCADPPRSDTLRTLQEAKKLGLSVKMLTGDAVEIARETAANLSMGTKIYNAERLDVDEDKLFERSEFYDFVAEADGFAEVFPDHKYRVVDILQQKGYLVAMTGDGVNDVPSLRKADTGIAVEGSTDAARTAADIVFLAPGLSAIIDAIKTSRQIFHRMYSYVVYRIALSLHLEIFLGLWIAIFNRCLDINLVVFIAIFADVATLAVAYDNAPYSQNPVKWNLPKLWGIAVVLGCILALSTWILLSTTFGTGSGIIQGYGNLDSVLFLEISLSQSWLIFATRTSGPCWSSLPSWELTGAVVIVDILATLFCLFGWFGGPTSGATILRVWIFSFGVFCVCSGLYYVMSEAAIFDRLMNGKLFDRFGPSTDHGRSETHLVGKAV